MFKDRLKLSDIAPQMQERKEQLRRSGDKEFEEFHTQILEILQETAKPEVACEYSHHN